MNSYTLGDAVRVSVVFANTNGFVTDPSAITCKVKQPSGTITTNTYGDGHLLKDSTGMYHLDIVASVAGVWSFRFIGAGVCTTASDAEFFVQPSDFGASG